MIARGERALPPGYTHFVAGTASVVALAELVESLRVALDEGTLYEYAAHHPDAHVLTGRGVVYAVPLPEGGPTVVVRRSRHGGLLRALTGDRFAPPTRAPRELATALRLARAGVATPELVAYATYAAGPLLRRADVLTRHVAGARDLGAILCDSPSPDLARALRSAVARLLATLTDAGARHPDLTVKNVLVVADENGGLEALVADVDRVWFDRPGSPAVTEANVRRFERSARKWRRLRGASLSEAELRDIAATIPGLARRATPGAAQ